MSISLDQALDLTRTGDVEPRPLDPRSGEGRAVLDRMLRSMHELAGGLPPRLDDGLRQRESRLQRRQVLGQLLR